jgi:hypothetical protein
MKKLTIVLLAFLFVGLGNVVAQTATEDVTTVLSADQQFKANCPDWGTDKCPFTTNKDGKIICKKTGKECSAKQLKSCCKSKRKGCSGKKGSYKKSSKNYSSGANSGFNFSKKSSCSSKAAKKCGEGCTKSCCAKTDDVEEGDDESSEE